MVRIMKNDEADQKGIFMSDSKHRDHIQDKGKLGTCTKGVTKDYFTTFICYCNHLYASRQTYTRVPRKLQQKYLLGVFWS